MKNNDLNIDALTKTFCAKDSFLKKRNGNVYLSDEDAKILKKYGIDYHNYNDVKQLIFDIEDILNEEDYEDLESLSSRLSELNYYNNTNK